MCQDSTLSSPPGNRAIVSTFWGDFLAPLHRKTLERKEKNPLEKIQEDTFLSLVVVETTSASGKFERRTTVESHKVTTVFGIPGESPAILCMKQRPERAAH